MNNTSTSDSRAADRAYAASRLVRFGDAADVTLGGPGCQADCSGKSRPADTVLR